jgi:hypothetical protein
MKKVVISIAILIIVLVTVILVLIPNKNIECKTDSDCLKVQTSCCSCNSGGQESCVPKENATLIQEQLKNCSKNMLCAEFFNCNIKSCQCKEGKCQGS